MRARLSRADLVGIVIVVTCAAAAIGFRMATIEPRAFVGICAASHPPLVCAPRHAVLWLQYERLFGFPALLLGGLAVAFARRPLGITGFALGIIAVVNYNGTEGIIGAALGLWGWLEAATPGYIDIEKRRTHARE